MNRNTFIAIVVATIVALGLSTNSFAQSKRAPKGKVKIFLLVGQSNMQGKGSVKHLEELIEKEPDRFGHLKDGDNWAERDDVWIHFTSMQSRKLPVSGPLKVGYTYPPGKVGPELGIGKVLGDAIDEPVVLLKACWGGQSLAVDFRPPSRGGWDREFNRDDGKKYKPATVGWAYKQIFNEMHAAFDDMETTFPDLAGRDIEIAGLIWFQGWNDLINGKRVDEYEENMVAFIKDIRTHLETPDLPIVIGLMGQNGEEANDKMKKMRAAQAAPAAMPEFKDTVSAVPTAPYWDASVKYDGGYHYMGSARFYYDAGEAFGKSMLELLENQKAKAKTSK